MPLNLLTTRRSVIDYVIPYRLSAEKPRKEKVGARLCCGERVEEVGKSAAFSG